MKKWIETGDVDFSLVLNVTFDPIVRENEPPTIYYRAFYGDALPYPRKEEVWNSYKDFELYKTSAKLLLIKCRVSRVP